jgi:hypothetical protein
MASSLPQSVLVDYDPRSYIMDGMVFRHPPGKIISGIRKENVSVNDYGDILPYREVAVYAKQAMLPSAICHSPTACRSLSFSPGFQRLERSTQMQYQRKISVVFALLVFLTLTAGWLLAQRNSEHYVWEGVPLLESRDRTSGGQRSRER